MNAKAIAQAAALDEAARSLKRAAGATRDALHTVRRIQEELLDVETIATQSPSKEAQDGTTQDTSTGRI